MVSPGFICRSQGLVIEALRPLDAVNLLKTVKQNPGRVYE